LCLKDKFSVARSGGRLPTIPPLCVTFQLDVGGRVNAVLNFRLTRWWDRSRARDLCQIAVHRTATAVMPPFGGPPLDRRSAQRGDRPTPSHASTWPCGSARIICGRQHPRTTQHRAQQFYAISRPTGEVGKRAVLGLAALAVALAPQDRGRR